MSVKDLRLSLLVVYVLLFYPCTTVHTKVMVSIDARITKFFTISHVQILIHHALGEARRMRLAGNNSP